MSIQETLRQRILILDGAMGTMIQGHHLSVADFHKGQFARWPVSLVGNNDVLNLTAPHVIAAIHQSYIDAGADIITTNTFSSNRVSQKEYHCEDTAAAMARAGAAIARGVADSCRERHVWVAGSMGPTSKTLSLASDLNQPMARAITFDELATAYGEQAEALIQGGADLLLLETCFDALNTKAALYAIARINEQRGTTVPVMVSATINDRSGRTLTGQTLEAFYVSVAHYPLLSFGLNCSFGVTELRPFIEQLAQVVPVFTSLHPNAGLPNEMGQYDEQPEHTARHLRSMAEAGLLNIVGGCCGITPAHISAIAQALKGLPPRHVGPQPGTPAPATMQLSGLTPLYIAPEGALFTNIGERTNVAGSRKFARLIANQQYEEAATVARHQIEGGAAIIDINMDDAMLDSRREMGQFLRYIANEPAIANAVFMIDSSDWPTVIEGLKNTQGKGIVNSISLKEGEQSFLRKASELRRFGAAVVVMAFDEQGQATTYERKTAIARRAYDLLTAHGFPPQDIIFDVNILSVGTGIDEHAAYGIDFIRAVEWIKHHLPAAKTSGGVSNLSFAFRGNNTVREAMHSVFLYHAIRAGLDMGIVNPAMLQVYDEIPPQLLRACEDVILNSDSAATERLIDLAQTYKEKANTASPTATDTPPTGTVEQRLTYALTHGTSEHLPHDIPEALHACDNNPVAVIEGPLMQAMEHVGRLFGEGKMFLPQVVKSAKVMKDAVAILQPYIEQHQAHSQQSTKPVVVLATANGDVHDIGKNIVAIVLACNNFDVHDLGVMVSNEAILQATLQWHPCLVGVSGLITPSLKEMEELCRLFQQHHMRVPIIVGGATTSAVHTAVRLAPLYDYGVAYGGDASLTAVIAKKLLAHPEATLRDIKDEQQQVRQTYEQRHTELTPYEEANRLASEIRQQSAANQLQALHDSQELQAFRSASPENAWLVPLDWLVPLIDWRTFLAFWGFHDASMEQTLENPEARKTLAEGQAWLQQAVNAGTLSVGMVLQQAQAVSRGNDLVLHDGTVLPMLRAQTAASGYRSLADYYDASQPAPIGLFCIAAKSRATHDDPKSYDALLDHALRARLAEACATWMQQTACGTHNAIRPAFGYPACPDHSLKQLVFDHTQAATRLGIRLTDHYSIEPSTSICGLLIPHAQARYLAVGPIDSQQLADYCRRRGISIAEGERQLSRNLQHPAP